MHYIKLTIGEVNESSLQSLAEYAQSLINDFGLPNYTDISGSTACIYTSDYNVTEHVCNEIISHYETLGMELDYDVNLYDLTVFISDPELQAKFVCARLNINASVNEMLTDVSNEHADAINTVDKKIVSIDSYNTLNYVYKNKEVLTAILQGLYDHDIDLVEDINEIVSVTVN